MLFIFTESPMLLAWTGRAFVTFLALSSTLLNLQASPELLIDVLAIEVSGSSTLFIISFPYD